MMARAKSPTRKPTTIDQTTWRRLMPAILPRPASRAGGGRRPHCCVGAAQLPQQCGRLPPPAREAGRRRVAGIGLRHAAGWLVVGCVVVVFARARMGAAFPPAGFFLSVVGALVILFVLRRVP